MNSLPVLSPAQVEGVYAPLVNGVSLPALFLRGAGLEQSLGNNVNANLII
jgi:hypothetical protein